MRHVYAAVILFLCLGCGPREVVTDLPDDEKNLRAIATAYLQTSQELGRAPTGSDELRKNLKSAGDPDKILVSPNDGQPYVIVTGFQPGPKADGGTILAYEHTGKDGVRKAVDMKLVVHRVTTDEFKNLKFPSNYKPK